MFWFQKYHNTLCKKVVLKVGDTGEFGKYGENDNFARMANKAKRKAMRGP